MSALTVLSVLGTRPEAIKMAPVIRALERREPNVRSIVCSTGQHRDMLDQALGAFDIRVDLDLQVMRPDQSLSGLTASLLEHLDTVVDQMRPDWIVAQGDTTSVLVAALVAYYRRIGFAHVEAGLRTGNLSRPFPEEANRAIADILAHVYFAPTPRSRDALIQAGCLPDRVIMTGNTVVDALTAVKDKPYNWSQGPLGALPESGRYVLITAHRRESMSGPLQDMFLALRDLAELHAKEDVQFVYPVHLNPRVRRHVDDILAGQSAIHLLEPLDYLSMVNLMKRSILILTDSGGIQEEAPTLHVPVLVMRNETERPEAVEAGVARLVGTRREDIVREASLLIENEAARRAMVCDVNPFGDGQAAARIADALLAWGKAEL